MFACLRFYPTIRGVMVLDPERRLNKLGGYWQVLLSTAVLVSRLLFPGLNGICSGLSW
jgi:hypothetical protein